MAAAGTFFHGFDDPYVDELTISSLGAEPVTFVVQLTDDVWDPMLGVARGVRSWVAEVAPAMGDTPRRLRRSVWTKASSAWPRAASFSKRFR